MPAERMPTSQAARAARVGRLAATEAVRHAGAGEDAADHHGHPPALRAASPIGHGEHHTGLTD
jgi:hypothetical protein